MSYKNLKNRIKKNEGFSAKPYKDQLGFLTIGYGHLILSNEKNLIQEQINKSKLEKIFLEDFENAKKDFNIFFKKKKFNNKTTELLIEMIFQLGLRNVLKFKKLLKYLKKGNRYLVCFEMMNSLWYNQTPNRVKGLIIVFLQNE